MMTGDDMERIFETHEALYGAVSKPMDGDDYTWDEPCEEGTQPWQEDIMERLARLEAELAELKRTLEGEL